MIFERHAETAWQMGPDSQGPHQGSGLARVGAKRKLPAQDRWLVRLAFGNTEPIPDPEVLKLLKGALGLRT